MLGLKLREEFLGDRTPKTAIELFKGDQTGAAQQEADKILEITYPTYDTRKALIALNSKKPVVLIGERGQGKSHIMAVLHHAIKTPGKVETWAQNWSKKIESIDDKFENLKIPQGYYPITEALSNNEYSNLWDLLFNKHPRGEFYKGKFSQLDQPVPPKSLIAEMFQDTQTVLILDEYQTWFDGLQEKITIKGTQYKPKAWAFNFIQNLSELSKEIPDKFILVVSVRNNSSDAYRQIHRDNPELIDFSSTLAKEDRKKLILHRLFENRDNIVVDEIRNLTKHYIEERERLFYENKAGITTEDVAKDVVKSWPFSPELLNLMDDHILMGETAQSSRDLIKILAELYKARASTNVDYTILTPADFYVHDDSCGVTSLLDSISSGDLEKLRDIAIRNLEAVRNTDIGSQYVKELISSIWLRSLTQEIKTVGATAEELHLDITKRKKIDDNSFNVELTSIVEMSFNIHKNEKDKRFSFKEEENPETKLRAYARNDKNFQLGEDKEELAVFLRAYLEPASSASESSSRVIVLDELWEKDPWQNKKEQDIPKNWNTQVLIVMPYSNTNPSEILGVWLKEHVIENRNMVRFLLPKQNLVNLYHDHDILFNIRCIIKAKDWGISDPKYVELKKKFEKELEKLLENRFDRFAVLTNWNFQNPKTCKFEIDKHCETGLKIPRAIEAKIKDNIFAPEDFRNLVYDAVRQSQTVGDIFTKIKEPPPQPDMDAVPYLGESVMYEMILRIVAKDSQLAINARGTWHYRSDGMADDDAFNYLKRNAYATGKDMYTAKLGLTRELRGGAIGTSVQGAVIPPENIATTKSGLILENPQDISPATINQGAQITQTSESIMLGNNNGKSLVEEHKHLTVKKSDEAKNGMNLLGDLERWTQGLPVDERLPFAKLEFDDLTPQEIRSVLAKLPLNIKAKMEILVPEKEELHR